MIFITGSSGFLGSYLVEKLLKEHTEPLNLLIRAKNKDEAQLKLWEALQLHMTNSEFHHLTRDRIHFYCGDLTASQFGLSNGDWQTLIETTTSIIHCAASLNRKSEKTCMNVNLRGTLQMIKLARAAHDHHGLRRFSFVSTVAVAGARKNEIIAEDASVDWNRSDYDPYARTKKYCEHMIFELLPDISTLIFRPSIVMGDSRFSKTTQFDMTQAFVSLTKLPFLPFSPDMKLDIVPANFVGYAIVDLHQKEKPLHRIYHLSAGTNSQSFETIVNALHAKGLKKPSFFPRLETTFETLLSWATHTPKSLGLASIATLLKVFMPYLTFNTVFENTRATSEVGYAPAVFTDYAYGLYQFVTQHDFQYPSQPFQRENKNEK